MTKNIVIADDHPLFREAIKSAVRKVVPQVAIFEADNLSGARQRLAELDSCSLVLLDLYLPDVEGFSGLLQLRSDWAQYPVAIVSACTDPEVVDKAIRFGASGYIPKTLPLETICDALLDILDGEVWLPEGMEHQIDNLSKSVAYDFASLTPAQLKVLGYLKNGKLNKQIAYDMGISEATVKAHMTAIFRKLNVRSRTQAVIASKDLDLPETA